MPDDLAAENRHLRGIVKRLEEALTVLREQYACAQETIRELQATLPGNAPRVGTPGVNSVPAE